jgi:ribosomal protein S18 acetylase RimI-like enzyme
VTRTADQLATLEEYYDAAPRPTATTEDVGPFTLFLRTDAADWPFYARPGLGLEAPVTTADVDQVRARQRELGVPETLEWVHETTPTLSVAARDSGLAVHECPLLVLPPGVTPAAPEVPRGVRVEILAADSPHLGTVSAAVNAGFAGRDAVEPRGAAGAIPRMIRDGLLVTVGAFDGAGPVGGGSHSPRGTTTELAGIAVLPRARRRGIGAVITGTLAGDAFARGISTIFLSASDDAVARVYERIGFVRVGTACVAEAPED